VKREIIRFGMSVLALTFCMALVWTGLAPAAAAQLNSPTAGTLKGTIVDETGKPIDGAVILIRSEATGVEVQAKTNPTGNYSQSGLAGGIYDLTIMVKDEIVYRARTNVVANHDMGVNINLGDAAVKAFREEARKTAEENKRASTMNEHYEAGKAALTQATDLHKLLAQTPADQRDALRTKIETSANQAIQEFQIAMKSLGEDASDNDKRTFYAQIGNAYDAEEKYDEEADVLRKAAEINPPSAAYYNNLGNALAKGGKIDEATAAYDKSAALDPKNAAQAYRNLGIVLFNAGQMGTPKVIDVMKKATDMDPNNAQGWFLLGVALGANMQAKQVGDKMTFTILPGTVEAYQKCIQLSPDGPLAAQAKAALEELKAMGAGVDTKVTAPKVKH